MTPRRSIPLCEICGVARVRRPGARRCRACSNRLKAGTFTPETARRAAIRRRDRGRENARLADIARELGLISDLD